VIFFQPRHNSMRKLPWSKQILAQKGSITLWLLVYTTFHLLLLKETVCFLTMCLLQWQLKNLCFLFLQIPTEIIFHSLKIHSAEF
jgi:hypothetical protein